MSWTTSFSYDLLDVGDSLRTFLVYGRSSFCCRVLDALKGHGWLPSDSVLVVGGSRDRRLLSPGLPMKWRSLSHSSVGGVTGGKYRVGCTTNLLTHGDIPLDLSSGITRKLSALLKVSGGGNDCEGGSYVGYPRGWKDHSSQSRVVSTSQAFA